MKKELEKIVNGIKATNTEDAVYREVDNAKSEYVYDWEDDFDSLEEAYEEQGRGEAESMILNDLIAYHGGKDLSMDDHHDVFTALSDHYHLNTN